MIAAVLLITSTDAVSQPTAPGGEHWSKGQLDQLTAPIALYPDRLLGSILAASTYPLEVVEATRWLDDPAHVALSGDDLAAAAEGQHWDLSIKSLLPFPTVLHIMDSNLEWTEELGDAFLAQQGDVMQSIQRLRQRAVGQGTLRSTPQQTVTEDASAISIEPVSPDIVYVPYYVPGVYGGWEWPDYPPYYFVLPSGVVLGDALIGFGVGVGFAVFQPWWGWYGFNWLGGGVVVYPPYPHPPGNSPRPRPPLPRPIPNPWQHDPQHRDGVPYRDAATATRYLGTPAGDRRTFRGFPIPAAAQSSAPEMPRSTAPASANPPSYERAPAPAPHAAPPAFESFGHGPQVRSEAARGFSSRSMSSAPTAGGHAGHREP